MGLGWNRHIYTTCVQLTDNAARATAGAAQRFLASCRSAILRANHRSDDEANATITATGDDTAIDLFRPPAIELLNNINCPLCLPRLGIQRECCGNGQCANGTCQCSEGKSSVISLFLWETNQLLFYTNKTTCFLASLTQMRLAVRIKNLNLLDHGFQLFALYFPVIVFIDVCHCWWLWLAFKTNGDRNFCDTI